MCKCLNRSTTGILIILVCCLLILPGCQLLRSVNPFQDNVQDPANESGNPDKMLWYSVYFTDPGSPQAASYEGGPGEAAAEAIQQARISVDEAIQQARISVDVAAYSFNLWEIRDALLGAHRRGVSVRLVTDSDNYTGDEVQELLAAGIPVKHDHSQSLMHNKFIVIDRLEVWTGSMNPTLGGAYYDNNNLVRIRSTGLANNYTAEFEEMFVDMGFSRGSMDKTPQTTFEIEDTLVENYFSPEDGTARRIVELIESARHSVYFLAYAFTADDIAAAMIDRSLSGVKVAGVMESSQYKSNTGTEYEHLLSAGVDVHLDGNPDNMHHKVIIIDETIVITGSYNFSASAEDKNDENTLIIHNPEIAALFIAEYERVYNEAQ
jgi:phosphatidylserine/phosphatidylglycerophosphate/cardiolipin synthase-like enzyme